MTVWMISLFAVAMGAFSLGVLTGLFLAGWRQKG